VVVDLVTHRETTRPVAMVVREVVRGGHGSETVALPLAGVSTPSPHQERRTAMSDEPRRPTVDDVDPEALAVHSVDDITRTHGDGDETERVASATGDIEPVAPVDEDEDEDDDGTGTSAV
jgi:hypothetical protein